MEEKTEGKVGRTNEDKNENGRANEDGSQWLGPAAASALPLPEQTQRQHQSRRSPISRPNSAPRVQTVPQTGLKSEITPLPAPQPPRPCLPSSLQPLPLLGAAALPHTTRPRHQLPRSHESQTRKGSLSCGCDCCPLSMRD
eukprot:411451-Rhodomonas_salina.4